MSSSIASPFVSIGAISNPRTLLRSGPIGKRRPLRGRIGAVWNEWRISSEVLFLKAVRAIIRNALRDDSGFVRGTVVACRQLAHMDVQLTMSLGVEAISRTEPSIMSARCMLGALASILIVLANGSSSAGG